MKKIIKVAILNLCFVTAAYSQKVELTPLYNSIGIRITDFSSYDSCSILYKASVEDDWRRAYPPNKVTISDIEQLRGSLFLLQENTAYDIKVVLWEGHTSIDLPILKSTTLVSPTITPTQNVKWVSPNGQGDYSKNKPGNIT